MENRIKWVVCVILAIIALFILNKFADRKEIADQVTVIVQDSSKFEVSSPAPKITIPPANYDFGWINQMQSIDSLKMALIQAITDAKTVREYDSTHIAKNTSGDTLAIATLKQTVTDNRLSKYSLNIKTFNKEITIREQLKWGIMGGVQFRKDSTTHLDLQADVMLPKMTLSGFKEIGGNGFGMGIKLPIIKNYGK